MDFAALCKRKSCLRFFRCLVLTIVSLAVAYGVGQWCRRRTAGFRWCYVQPHPSSHRSWTVPPLAPERQAEIENMLRQPFRFLGKGAQCYAFVSEDGQYVVKFFRHYRGMPPYWMQKIASCPAALPFSVRERYQASWNHLQKKLAEEFESYQIAYEKLQEETGILYLHLTPDHKWNFPTTFYDRIGCRHEVVLSDLEFVLQRKADLIYPTLAHLMRTGQEQAAQAKIASLVELIVTRAQRGLFDKDPDIETNFGFLGNRAIQIDIGRYREDLSYARPEIYRDELIRVTDEFADWLRERYPSLEQTLQQELTRYCHDPL